MRHLERTLVALAACCAASSATASEVQSSSSSQVVATIPFHPPLGKTLRYRVTKTGDGLPPQRTAEVLENLQYQKSPDGYLLTITVERIMEDGGTYTPTTGPVIIKGRQLDTVSRAEDRIGLLGPVTLELNERGEVERVHNWPDLQQAIRTLPDRVASSFPVGGIRTEVRNLVATTYAPLSEVSPEGPIGFAGREWPIMLGFNAKSFLLGQPMVVPGAVAIMGQTEPVTYTQTVLVSQDADGTFSLKESQIYDRESFNAAVRRAEEAHLLPKDASSFDKFLRVAQIFIDYDEVGIISHGSWVIQYKDDADKAVQTTTNTFERLN